MLRLRQRAPHTLVINRPRRNPNNPGLRIILHSHTRTAITAEPASRIVACFIGVRWVGGPGYVLVLVAGPGLVGSARGFAAFDAVAVYDSGGEGGACVPDAFAGAGAGEDYWRGRGGGGGHGDLI